MGRGLPTPGVLWVEARDAAEHPSCAQSIPWQSAVRLSVSVKPVLSSHAVEQHPNLSVR